MNIAIASQPCRHNLTISKEKELPSVSTVSLFHLHAVELSVGENTSRLGSNHEVVVGGWGVGDDESDEGVWIFLPLGEFRRVPEPAG